MKIKKLHIKNFRSFEDEDINLNNYTCFVGPNGSGKSNIITALNIFFRETENAATNLVELSDEDFHKKNTNDPIIITVTFDELSDEAKRDLKDYVRQDQLVVSAKACWDKDTKSALVKQYGERLGIKEFSVFFAKDKEGAKAEELNTIYSEFQKNFPDLLAARSKADKEVELHKYEAAHPELCELIPSEDQFYGISRGVNRLGKYVQWVYVPAVKDAATEQAEARNTALGRLLSRRVHSQMNIQKTIGDLKQKTLTQYEGILNANIDALKKLSDSLNIRFQQWAHQNAEIRLDWQRGEGGVNIAQPIAEVKTTEGQFEGKLVRFGHGLQRSFIFALLQEESEHMVNTGPKLILACEEPELYQHPPQIRYLAALLQRLSLQNSQILVCTHNPDFVSGKNFEDIRMVIKNPQLGYSIVTQVVLDDVIKDIVNATGNKFETPGGLIAQVEKDMLGAMNEMFFASVRIFVEGQEDAAYINSYLSLMGLSNDFRRLGCHIVPVYGKSRLIYAVAISKCLNLPHFVVFDADSDTPIDTPEKITGRRQQQENENIAIFKLMEEKTVSSFPAKDFWGSRVVVWQTNIGDIISSEISDIGTIKQTVRSRYNILTGDMEKNPLFIGYFMAEAWDNNKKSPSLEKLCKLIIEYAKSLDKP